MSLSEPLSDLRVADPLSRGGTSKADPTHRQYIYWREALDPTPVSRTVERADQCSAFACI